MSCELEYNKTRKIQTRKFCAVHQKSGSSKTRWASVTFDACDFHSKLLNYLLVKNVLAAVKTGLRAPIFLNHRNFETERYTSERHKIKSLDLQDIYEFDSSFFVVTRFVTKLREFKKIGARCSFLTAVKTLSLIHI